MGFSFGIRGSDIGQRTGGTVGNHVSQTPARERREATDPDQLQRFIAEEAFSRTTGAPLVTGNSVRLLLDAEENYPSWKEAIESAERTVHLEMYILRDDRAGQAMAELLIARAQDGVRVRVLYDWLGALGGAGRRFWSHLRSRGVEVRCSNPPRLHDVLAWVSRDHRKVLTVDGRVGFVSGLCVGQEWWGWPERGVDPWRDTGVEIRGPAVADLERAFAQIWAMEGEPLDESEIPTRDDLPPAGDQALRVVASSPETTGLFRLDLLWAAIARRRLWIADAYFMGTPAYVGALRAAARGGVDVRLLVPSASDIRIIAAFSRTQYRPLLEAGVRVFEWNGAMMHAKTAVVDGLRSRVGSTNLNLASWVGNWEIDVCVEDAGFGREMEAAYRRDLERSTEMVLNPRRRVQPAAERGPRPRAGRASPGSAGRAAAAALHMGSSLGTALTQRGIADAEARAFAGFGILCLFFAALLLWWPRALSFTAAIAAGYLGIALLVRAWRLWRGRAR
jgi:cardiolipin synthase